jgi:DNA-binding NtrC family response regulator
MKSYGKLLIVDDSDEVLSSLGSLFRRYFDRVDCERNPNLIPSYISRDRYDAYILKMNYKSGVHNGNEGIYWMNRIFEEYSAAVVVLTSFQDDVETAVRAIKEGAADFIRMPCDGKQMCDTVLSACRPSKHAGRNTAMRTRDRKGPGIVNIVGSSESMRKLLLQVSKVAGTDANVLITGENGTGKELIARTLHRQSGRAAEAFIPVDMGSLSGSLFESELFGHARGAFTDAHEERPGRFEMAHGGSLFLDEIGNLPPSLQVKLLSAIQNRQIFRVGKNIPVPVDIRLITATNMPLERMVREGRFREDLLYRINTVSLHVPPLRERKNDIKPLFHHFKQKFENRYSRPGLEVDAGVFDALLAWHWPGNIRELEHAVEKAVIMCDSGVIRPSDFVLRAKAGVLPAEEAECFDLQKNEKRIINSAIDRCGGNLSQASRMLGITRKTLYNKISKYGI